MARRYDFRTTIFSPEGRLYQVEYAMEAISHAGAAVGILAKDGIVLAAEKKNPSKLLEQSLSSEKMYKLDDHVACAVAGITADANILINYARLAAQRYLFAYQEQIPVEQLVQQVCDQKQGYTQFGGLRPFGVSILYAGYDRNFGFQLYMSDPSGNYGGWKATAIGQNNPAANSILKTEWKDDFVIKDALHLAVKVLSKTMDSTTLSAEKLDLATLTKTSSGKVVFRTLLDPEVEGIVKIIKETTDRLNRLQKQASENEVKLYKMKGDIEEEKMKGDLLKIKHDHHRAKALMEGEAEADEIKAFLKGLDQSIPMEVQMQMWNALRKLQGIELVSKGNSQMYFTPNDVNLSIEGISTNNPVVGRRTK